MKIFLELSLPLLFCFKQHFQLLACTSLYCFIRNQLSKFCVPAACHEIIHLGLFCFRWSELFPVQRLESLLMKMEVYNETRILISSDLAPGNSWKDQNHHWKQKQYVFRHPQQPLLLNYFKSQSHLEVSWQARPLPKHLLSASVGQNSQYKLPRGRCYPIVLAIPPAIKQEGRCE